MGKQRDLHQKWKRAKTQLDELFANPQHVVLAHYSCESFYDRTSPTSPRVTSIAVRNLDSGQTRSFSIHLIAERRSVLDSIDQHYDSLEREMLEGFYDFVRAGQHLKWLHWNMRDANYGFEALENRLKALGGLPAIVPESNRYDLSRLLVAIYGVNYIEHPRLESLMKRNHIVARDFQTGQEEANAFDNKEFVRLHQSTLRKVDVLANIAGRAHAGDLDTRATWWQQNGKTIKALGEWCREHWLLGALAAVAAVAAAMVRAWPYLQRLLW